MVEIKTIIDIIQKCSSPYYLRPSQREYYYNKLNELGYSEDMKSISLESYCNPLEYNDYIQCKEELDSLYGLRNATLESDNQITRQLSLSITELERKVLFYEKRLVTGESHNKESIYDEVNGDSFLKDNKEELEDHQIIETKKVLDTFSDDEWNSLRVYFNEGSQYINGKLYDTSFFNELLKNNEVTGDYDKLISNMDNALDKTNGLLQDTRLYTAIPFDIHLNVGDTFNWDGFTSLSYQEYVAKRFLNKEYGHKRYLVQVLTPKGKKGFPANTKGLSKYYPEHEYLIGASKGRVVGYTEDSVIVILE
jgi:hypothetical protein